MVKCVVKYQSLDHELNTKGFLSLNKALRWLKEYYPQAAVSYPTALGLIKDGHLRPQKVGQVHRLSREELVRFGTHGNWDPSQAPADAAPSTPEFTLQKKP